MLTLTLYGRFSLHAEGTGEIALTSRRARALLAYLALPVGKPRSREAVMALLWSDRGEAQARASLRQVLAGLRRELGPHTGALVTDNDTLMLDPAQVTVAADTGEPFLDGLNVNDPAYEEWVRDLRLAEPAPADSQNDTGGQPDIAVLPFESISEDTSHDWFADGVTEDILSELARFRSLTLYPPWSSFHYNQDKTTEEIALELEVDYILEGSVRRAGDRLRINAALFDLDTVNHVWSRRFDRVLGDPLAIQAEVAADVATAVGAKLEADACDEAREKRSTERTALDHTLLGEWAQQQDWNAEEALRHYEKAITLDPDNARAQANLANWHAHSSLALFVPRGEAKLRTRAFAETALTLDATDAVVLSIVADAYAEIGDGALAQQCLTKAIAQNPNDQTVMGFAASTLSWLGETEAALKWFERYMAHDPPWQSAAMELGLWVYYGAGAYAKAAASVARLTRMPLHIRALAAAAHARAGDLEEAARLRVAYEAGLPEGMRFADHIGAVVLKPEGTARTEAWMRGFTEAGFDV